MVNDFKKHHFLLNNICHENIYTIIVFKHIYVYLYILNVNKNNSMEIEFFLLVFYFLAYNQIYSSNYFLLGVFYIKETLIFMLKTITSYIV